jgi:hypothetical protein
VRREQGTDEGDEKHEASDLKPPASDHQFASNPDVYERGVPRYPEALPE